jgi:hypothetical protein
LLQGSHQHIDPGAGVLCAPHGDRCDIVVIHNRFSDNKSDSVNPETGLREE